FCKRQAGGVINPLHQRLTDEHISEAYSIHIPHVSLGRRRVKAVQPVNLSAPAQTELEFTNEIPQKTMVCPGRKIAARKERTGATRVQANRSRTVRCFRPRL